MGSDHDDKGAPGSNDEVGDGAGPRVRRQRTVARSRWRPVVVASSVLVLLCAGLLVWKPWAGSGTGPRTATPSDVADDEGLFVGIGTTAPLTGIPVDESDAARLLRPALVAKIDGAPEAMPQEGLEKADLVMEVRVEGISRYLGVWHSQDVDEIGPVRSARTTDPDLIAALVRPLFSYSGGNNGVLRDLQRSDWFTDVSHDAVPGAYSRSAERSAPRDLMADTGELWDRTPAELAVPTPLFTYSPETAGAGVPVRIPVAGFAVAVGSDARFVWDDEASRWLRFAHGIPHEDTDGRQLGFDNVVVVRVDYVPSAADRQSPEAVSVGSGRAWVFSSGTVAEADWSRPERTAPWKLSTGDGTSVDLVPGTTWMVLTDSDPLALDGTESARLLGDR